MDKKYLLGYNLFVINMKLLKNKRFIMVACATVFLVVLFLAKNTSLFEKKEILQENKQEPGLTYSNVLLGDLVNKDTDGDSVTDWEEKLLGTDPLKKETTPGIPDRVAIEKLRAIQDSGAVINTSNVQDNSKLTQTDQFSRDLFATVAAATQDGQPLDQATIDQISSSLADHIKNTPQRKLFTMSDLKVIKDDSLQAIKNYNTAWENISKKYPANGNVIDVLQKFEGDGNNVDINALTELDPIIERANKIVTDLAKMSVPMSLASLHLDLINTFQRLSENMSDIKLYDTDSVVALSGISQYNDNTIVLQTSINNLGVAMDTKLNISQ